MTDQKKIPLKLQDVLAAIKLLDFFDWYRILIGVLMIFVGASALTKGGDLGQEIAVMYSGIGLLGLVMGATTILPPVYSKWLRVVMVEKE
jgi:hypothetical protein